MPYHDLGSHLYSAVGLESPIDFDAEVDEESIHEFAKFFTERGIEVSEI